MKNRPCKSTGPSKIESHWNGLGTIERIEMILEYPDYFLSTGLATPREIKETRMTSKTEWEYIIGREEHPLFHNVDVTKEVSAQASRDELKTVLNFVIQSEVKRSEESHRTSVYQIA